MHFILILYIVTFANYNYQIIQVVYYIILLKVELKPILFKPQSLHVVPTVTIPTNNTNFNTNSIFPIVAITRIPATMSSKNNLINSPSIPLHNTINKILIIAYFGTINATLASIFHAMATRNHCCTVVFDCKQSVHSTPNK